MTSPKKFVDMEKDETMFGQLSKVQKHANTINKQMMTELQQIKRLKTDFAGMEKEGKHTAGQTKVKLNEEIKQFEERIKNYLITQKAQYMRFSNQINAMIQNSKEINSQLTLLGNKFGQFQKNVGI